MRLRVKGSDDAAGVESVHLSRWASPDDWEEFDPPAEDAADDGITTEGDIAK